MEKKNGYFVVEIRANGIFIMLYPPYGGDMIRISELFEYLKVNGLRFDEVKLRQTIMNMKDVTEHRLLSDTCHQVDEKVSVEIMTNKMSAIGRFFPPTAQGKRLTQEDIINAMTQAGVRYGLRQTEIDSFLQNRQYCTDYLLAEATPSAEGRNAVVTYHFSVDLNCKPKTNEDGSVDFHHLDLISHVKEGDLLAELIPSIPGKPGIDVTGKKILPPKVSSINLKFGNNIQITEDRLKLYSLVNGHVTLVDDTVFVSDIYKIEANVDASTGDIKYNGNVEIAGNVNTGFSVQADGDIVVNGVVEGATLAAGGKIILKRGIQGMNRGVLRAGTDIVTKFIESAEVFAGGFITTEAIMHSKVQAGLDISVGGRRGFITGGEIKSRTMISAKTAGSVMGTITLLEVGGDPELINELREKEKERQRITEENEKLEPAILHLTKLVKTEKNRDSVRFGQLSAMLKNRQQVLEKCTLLDQRIEFLKDQISNLEGGSIRIENIIFPGCKLNIDNVTMYIRNESKYCRFIREGADIRMMPY